MSEYHKIDTVYKRDPATKHKSLILGDYSRPEFEYLRDNRWVFTEKVDGTNIRINVDRAGAITYGGRTDNAQIPALLVNALSAITVAMTPEALLAQFPGGAAVLYGEGYGAKIQSGGNYRPDPSFVLFDVRIGDWWLQRSAIEEIGQKFSLDVVPIIGEGSLFDMEKMVRDGLESRWGPFTAEGVVARPETELRCRNGDRLITKLKHRDFA